MAAESHYNESPITFLGISVLRHSIDIKFSVCELLAVSCAFLGPCNVAHAIDESEPQPNIILMMADDMGMGYTSAYQDFTGNSDQDQLHTPAMEELARMGVRSHRKLLCGQSLSLSLSLLFPLPPQSLLLSTSCI